jgi:hypothetical protein
VSDDVDPKLQRVGNVVGWLLALAILGASLFAYVAIQRAIIRSTVRPECLRSGS